MLMFKARIHKIPEDLALSKDMMDDLLLVNG